MILSSPPEERAGRGSRFFRHNEIRGNQIFLRSKLPKRHGLIRLCFLPLSFAYSQERRLTIFWRPPLLRFFAPLR